MKYFISLVLLFSQLSLAKNDAHLNLLIKDACNKNIVILGEEGNHGGGQAILLKTQIIEKLIQECHFTSIYFESGFYDFIDFNHSIDNKVATRNQLANSIGGIWSFTQEMDGLIKYLFKKAQSRKVKLAGLDLQFGITNTYAQKQLPKDMTSFLKKDKVLCEKKISQHINWQYTDKKPFNGAEKVQLNKCAIQISSSLEKQNQSKKIEELKQLTANFIQYLAMLDGNNFNIRDKQMFDNVLWLNKQQSKHEKIIIWTANIHALKSVDQISTKIKPMGVYIATSFKDQSFALGISAQSGQYYNRFKAGNAEITNQDLQSLEAQIQSSDDCFYLNPNKLQSLSAISSIVLDYENPKKADWSKMFDGILVINKEKPVHKINLQQ